MSNTYDMCPGCGARKNSFYALCHSCKTLLENNRLRHVAQHAQDWHQHSFSSLSNQKFLKKERYKREAVEHLHRLRNPQEATHAE